MSRLLATTCVAFLVALSGCGGPPAAPPKKVSSGEEAKQDLKQGTKVESKGVENKKVATNEPEKKAEPPKTETAAPDKQAQDPVAFAGGDLPARKADPELARWAGLPGAIPVRGFQSLAWSKDAQFFYTSDLGNNLEVWRASDWKRVAAGESYVYFDRIALSKAGDWLLGIKDTLLEVRDARSLKSLRKLEMKDAQRAVELAPGDKSIAVLERDGTIYLLDPKDFSRSGELQGPVGQSSFLMLQFSAQGDRLATFAHGIAKEIHVWDVASRQLLKKLGPDGENLVYGFAFYPDGKRLLACGATDLVVWNLETGMIDRRIGEDLGVMGKALVAISPDGKLAAVGVDDRLVVFDAESGERLNAMQGHPGHVEELAFSPDSAWLASGDSDLIRLWDCGRLKSVKNAYTATLDERKSFFEHGDGISSVAFSPDGKSLTSADSRSRVFQRRLDDGTVTVKLKAGVDADTDVVYSADGADLMVATAMGVLQVCRAADGTQLHRHTGLGFENISLLPGGKSLLGIQDKLAVVREIESGNYTREFAGQTVDVKGAAFAPTGEIVAAITGKTLKLWKFADASLLGSVDVVTEWPLKAVAFSPDGSRVVVGGSKVLQFFSVPDLKPVPDSAKEVKAVDCMAYSRDGQKLAAGDDKALLLIDVATGKSVRLLGHTNSIKAVAFSPDGSLVATGGYDATVKIWDATAK